MKYNRDIRFSLQKISIFILLLLHITGVPLHATEKEREIVLEVYPQWYSEEDLVIQGNAGIETDVQSSDWIEYYVKPSFAYAIDDKWALHGGLGFYYTNYKEEDDNFEVRPFVGISHFTPLTGKWKLSSYFRAEDRIQYNTSTKDKEDTLRLRLRLRTAYTINPISEENSWHKMTFGVEGFKSDTDDQTDSGIQDSYDYEVHISAGLERSLRDNQKLRFELSLKYQGKPSDIQESSASTVYFKIQYFPVWGETFANKLFHRGIEE